VEVIADHQGLAVRLTDERRAHILDHSEMAGFEAAIAETLKQPALVVQSISDEAAACTIDSIQRHGWAINSYAWS
jgi:hypothetical protein